MADKTFTITVKTEAELDALKKYQAELGGVKKSAAAAGGGLNGMAKGLQDASAATDPAMQLQQALAMVMSGDVTNGAALATGAVKGLSGALRANPIGLIITGLTVAAGLFTVFKTNGEEAAEGMKKMADEAKKAEEQLAKLNEQQASASAELLKKELEAIAAAYEKVAKAATSARRAKDELEDAQLGAGTAAIDVEEATGQVSGPEATARRTALRIATERRKLDRADEEQRALVSAAGSVLGTADLAANSVAGVAGTAQAAHDAALAEAQAAGAQGLSKKDAEMNLASAKSRGDMGDERARASDEEIADLQRKLAAVESLVTAQSELSAIQDEQRRSAAVREAAQTRFDEASATAKQTTTVSAVRRREIKSNEITAGAKLMTAAEEAGGKGESGATAQEEAPAVRAARLRFEALPPEQKAANLAQDAINGRTGDKGYTGQLARSIDKASKGLLDGDQGGEMDRVLKLMEEFANHAQQNTEQKKRVEARLQQIESQMKSGRS